MSHPENIEQHNREIHLNIQYLEKKPLLRKIYHEFYELLRKRLSPVEGTTVELGSGMGLIKQCIPGCTCTDLFENEWIDRVENAYQLSDATESVSNLILIDVFHHLRYPGTALEEWKRVIKPGGRILIFEPDMSMLGRIVYGIFHHEPIATKEAICWFAPVDWNPSDVDYYAAQGNAHRIFHKQQVTDWQKEWGLVYKKRFSFFSYVASGGFSKPQLYPTWLHSTMRAFDRVLDLLPFLSATRICIVLEKKKETGA